MLFPYKSQISPSLKIFSCHNSLKDEVNPIKEPEITTDEEAKDMITDETIDLSTLDLDPYDEDN